MKKWFTKVFNDIKIWVHSLATATKNVETQTLSQVSVDSVEGGINVVQDVNQGVHELAKALLRGELT